MPRQMPLRAMTRHKGVVIDAQTATLKNVDLFISTLYRSLQSSNFLVLAFYDLYK